MTKKISISTLFLLFICSVSFAQEEDGQGIWLMFFNRTQLTEKWSIHAEIQDRYYDLNGYNEQLLIRGGINYHHRKNLWFTAGYGLIETYPVLDTQEFTVKEDRIWQQVLYYHHWDRLFFEHRGRLEQRFVGDDYRNRARYRLMLSYPLNNEKILPGTFFLTAYNELFLHLESKPFDRNRLYGALAYQLSPNANIQGGWLTQRVGRNSRGYLQLALFANLDFTKK